MFYFKTVKKLREDLKTANENRDYQAKRRSEAEEKLYNIDSKHQEEISKINTNFQTEKNQYRREFESEKKIYRAEVVVEVNNKLREAEEINRKLLTEKAVLAKEVEVLQAAFKNMGLDVKDTKGILDSLVKGIVAKNEIKVIK